MIELTSKLGVSVRTILQYDTEKMYAIFNKYKIFYNGTKKYFAIQIKSSD